MINIRQLTPIKVYRKTDSFVIVKFYNSAINCTKITVEKCILYSCIYFNRYIKIDSCLTVVDPTFHKHSSIVPLW